MVDTLFPTQEIDPELVAEYARELVRNPSNREAIALRIVGGDFNLLPLLLEHASTPEFSKLVHKLNRDLPVADKLKSKEDFMLEVADRMTKMDGKLWLEAARFYSDLCGFTESKSVHNNVIQVISVPTVPQTEKDVTSWENKASSHAKNLQQQGREIANGNT